MIKLRVDKIKNDRINDRINDLDDGIINRIRTTNIIILVSRFTK